MTPAIAAVLGGGVTAVYVPILCGQIRDGEVGIPFGTINPIRVRRDEHPLAFRVAAMVMGLAVALLLIACAAIVIEDLVG